MTEVEQPPQNGIDLSANEEDESSKARPADIEQDMREMERRKRVEAIMGSKLFREELERIVDSARDSGNTAGILQQLSDIVGGPNSRVANVFKSSNCMMPINDIRGVESMGYAKGEKILRCKLAATFRLLDLYGWTQGLGAQITARLKVDQEYFLVNPYGLLYHEVTASSLNKVDMQGQIVEQGTTNFGVNKSHFLLHSAVHAARPDIRCAIYIGCSPVVAISSLKNGLMPLTKDACVLGDVTTFAYSGCFLDEEERNKLVRNLGPNSKVMLLTNHGALCCGETIEEAFFAACHIVQACETQLKLLPVGVDNLMLIPEESRKTIYEQSRRPPEDLEKKFAAVTAAAADSNKIEDESKKEEGSESKTKVLGQQPKWRVGGAEFEALMRMLDNAGFRTGYIYRHPLIKSDPPKPKNDVELPPAVSSLGYLLEEEELFRQGIWKKGALAKGGDRSRWLNSPNVYQKVEVLETGTPDPKKITKWVAEGSPTHSTPVRIDDPLQFVPVNTNPKEFKRLQQQIKDNRRADKISAGPQSHILEGVTWDEANRIKDATVSQAGDHVVLMGAASKGIIQRGFQHNATVYKAPYAKNPFDNVTDDELNEYKRTVERKKKSIHGEYTDTDFSESEALSSLQTSGAQHQTKQNTTTTTTTAAVSQSEPEDISEHQVMRIQTQQAPVPSQPEVVLSDATLSFINGERSHTVVNRKPPTGRDNIQESSDQDSIDYCQTRDGKYMEISTVTQTAKEDEEYFDATAGTAGTYFQSLLQSNSKNSQFSLFQEMEYDSLLYQSQKAKLNSHTNISPTMSPHNDTAHTKQLDQHDKNDHNNELDQRDSSPTSNISLTQDGNDNTTKLGNSSDSFRNEALEILKAQLEATLYSHTDPVCNQQDSQSYFPMSILNNSEAEDNNNNNNLSPVYDRPYESLSPPNVKIYNISLHCYTPTICAEIFQNFKNPRSYLQKNYGGAYSLQDLMWNNPYHKNNSPISMTPDNCCTPNPPTMTTPNSPIKSIRHSRSPYRTLSHFGFNSPQRDPHPDHKHVPQCRDDRKYRPLRRSVSYEEIFSSPRYIDLCEQCFEQLVRLKPDILHYRTKLRNLAEYTIMKNSNDIDGGAWHPAGDEDDDEEDAERGQPYKVIRFDGHNDEMDELSDETSYANTEAIQQHSIFSTNLEPLIEVEEITTTDSNEDAAPTESSFIDKIMCMNYSKESVNSFQNSEIMSAKCQMFTNRTTNEDDNGNKSENDENKKENDHSKRQHVEQNEEEQSNVDVVSNKLTNMVIDEQSEMLATYNKVIRTEKYSEETESCVYITEIWDFNDWRGERSEKSGEERVENDQVAAIAAKKDDTIVTQNLDYILHENPSAAAVSVTTSETQTDTNEDVGDDKADYLNEYHHSYTIREDRTRRKLEFRDLWEDHLSYYENREEIFADTNENREKLFSDTDTALSDTESALDVSTQFPIQQQPSNCLPKQLDNNQLSYIKCSERQETFETRSIILARQKSQQHLVPHASGGVGGIQEIDDDVKSSSSQRTFVISEGNSTENLLNHDKLIEQNRQEENVVTAVNDSQENMLFRSFGSSNTIGDSIMRGNRKQVHGRMSKMVDVNNVIAATSLTLSSNSQTSLGDAEECLEIQGHKEANREIEDNIQLLCEHGETACDEHEEKQLAKFEQNIGSKELNNTSSKVKCTNVVGAAIKTPLKHQNHYKIKKKAHSKVPMKKKLQNSSKLFSPEEELLLKSIQNTENEKLTGITLKRLGTKQKKRSPDSKTFCSNDNLRDEQNKENENQNDSTIDLKQIKRTNKSYNFFSMSDKYVTHKNTNKENCGTNEDEELSFVERKILQKIDFHQLNKSEDIFKKIEFSIRNKLTPSKLEMRIREQLLFLYNDEDTESPLTKETEDTHAADNLNSNRRSRSLTPFRYGSSKSLRTTDISQLRRSRSLTLCNRSVPLANAVETNWNKTLTPPNYKTTPKNRLFGTPHQGHQFQACSPASSNSNKSNNSNVKKRNFILENIRNASTPRNTYQHQLKRLRCNASAVFCKNPFGTRQSASSGNVMNVAPKTSPRSPPSLKCHSSPNFAENDIFPFQSKLIRGSPKMWVTLTQSPRQQKAQATAASGKKPKDKKKGKPQANRPAPDKSSRAPLSADLKSKMECLSLAEQSDEDNETVGSEPQDHQAAEVDENYSTNDSICDSNYVDDEINALGQEIQEIRPRLDSYKRKLDDFGDRVAKCARRMDECAATQEELVNVQHEMGEFLLLQQYSDEVTCVVQTYSLSETED